MNPVSPLGMIDGGLRTTLPCATAGGPPRPTGGPRYPAGPPNIDFKYFYYETIIVFKCSL